MTRTAVEATIKRVLDDTCQRVLQDYLDTCPAVNTVSGGSATAAPAKPMSFDFGPIPDRSKGNGIEFNMEEYCQDAVDLYCKTAQIAPNSLRKVATPFCPDGSLSFADEEARGELAGGACSVLMKALWLARLARPDLNKAIADLATHIHKWSRNDDKRVRRLYEYINATKHYRLQCFVRDPPELLELFAYVDADFAGNKEDSKSTSGGLLVLYGPTTWFPLCWVSKRQTSTSRSTTESEVVSLANFLFLECLPMLDLFDLLLQPITGKRVKLTVWEDNQACITVCVKGYSPKLRHILRTHKVNLGSVKEVIEMPEINLNYIVTDEQAADIFTKALAPAKWPNAIELLHFNTTPLPASDLTHTHTHWS